VPQFGTGKRFDDSRTFEVFFKPDDAVSRTFEQFVTFLRIWTNLLENDVTDIAQMMACTLQNLRLMELYIKFHHSNFVVDELVQTVQLNRNAGAQLLGSMIPTGQVGPTLVLLVSGHIEQDGLTAAIAQREIVQCDGRDVCPSSYIAL